MDVLVLEYPCRLIKCIHISQTQLAKKKNKQQFTCISTTKEESNSLKSLSQII